MKFRADIIWILISCNLNGITVCRVNAKEFKKDRLSV